LLLFLLLVLYWVALVVTVAAIAPAQARVAGHPGASSLAAPTVEALLLLLLLLDECCCLYDDCFFCELFKLPGV
jgi:hypothetical protein